MIRVTWNDQKWSRIAIRYGTLAGVAIGIVFSIWYYGLSERNVATVTVVCDARLSYATRESIEKFVQQLYPKSLDSDGAKQIFTCIKDIKTVRKRRTHKYIKFLAYTPAVVLNADHIVTLDGKLIGMHFYRSDTLSALPRIVTEQDISSAQLCQLAHWANTIPDFVKRQATITWKDQTEIALTFSAYPKNRLLITAQTALTHELINALKKIIALDGVVSVDARFDDMLIARIENKIKGKRRSR